MSRDYRHPDDRAYRDEMRTFLTDLDKHGAQTGNVAIFRLTTPQFFADWPDGAYGDTGKEFEGWYPCVKPANQTTANWRNDVIWQLWRELGLKHVLVVPTLPWMHVLWDSAQGARPNVIRGDTRSPRVADCSHLCEGPFLWEPLWWVVRIAAEALVRT